MYYVHKSIRKAVEYTLGFPTKRCQPPVHAIAEAHLPDWKQGNVPGLVGEGRSIQQRLKKKPRMSAKDTSRAISRLMMKGEVWQQ